MAGRYPDHRVRVALNVQHWRWLAFLHWPFDAGVLQRLVPPELEIDTFDGAAWLGVTPFHMRFLGTPGPAVPLVPNFVEVNVRTYVRGPDGRDGVWFFSLESPRLPVNVGLRLVGLPYMRATTALRWRAGGIEYVSRRPAGAGHFAARVRVSEKPASPDALANFLTGRWNAYSQAWGQLWRTPIEHEPWPLHAANARVDVNALLHADGLPALVGEPVAHFSWPRLHVRIGPPRRVSSASA